MCGIAGLLGLPSAEGERRAADMAAALEHRGPDASAAWADDGVALGHRRLSIIDLSPSGAQPMRSADGRYVLSYNGELYNYRKLSVMLDSAGIRLRGTSDTEVLVELIAHKGVEAALRLSNGMFAFAVWDRRERALTLARDRMGEKPLYYGRVGGRFAFASELKALALLPGFDRTVDRGALALYFRHNCVPAPYSIYEGIRKLPPASFIKISADGTVGEPKRYWDLKEAAERGSGALFAGTDEGALEHADALLRDAVRLRMEADVPLGAFLSGGIDSSLVAALMQAQSSRPIRTFTIGFPDQAYDESADAKAVAGHLKTEHTEFRVGERDALDVIPRLPEIYDEPFADSSQIPTFLVSRLARRHVTVALSGDGGDELFGGYNRYAAGAGLWRRLRRVPRPLRLLSAAAVGGISPRGWDRVMKAMGPALPRSMRVRTPGQKIRKLGEVLGARSSDEFYRRLITHWEPSTLVVGAREPVTTLTDPGMSPEGLDPVSRMMYFDMSSYLPDDILAKVDRATMAVSLESRVPLLDHRVVEFSWTLPLRFKIRDGATKWLLRKILERYVPAALFERPKMGFAVPLGVWLRGPLREWAENLLSESSLGAGGYLKPTPIRKKWAQHLAGKGDWEDQLWDVLMFETWRRRWLA